MKLLVLAFGLLVSQVGFAVEMPGIEKNEVMVCQSRDQRLNVLVFSDNYTTKVQGKLAGDPGRLYTMVGRMVRDESMRYSIETADRTFLPLKQVKKAGWLGDGLGVYQNRDFELDLSDRAAPRLFDKGGATLECHVLGDCC